MTRFNNRTINRIKRNFSRNCSTAYIVKTGASGGAINPFKDVLDQIGDVDYAEYDDESWK